MQVTLARATNSVQRDRKSEILGTWRSVGALFLSTWAGLWIMLTLLLAMYDEYGMYRLPSPRSFTAWAGGTAFMALFFASAALLPSAAIVGMAMTVFDHAPAKRLSRAFKRAVLGGSISSLMGALVVLGHAQEMNIAACIAMSGGVIGGIVAGSIFYAMTCGLEAADRPVAQVRV